MDKEEAVVSTSFAYNLKINILYNICKIIFNIKLYFDILGNEI